MGRLGRESVAIDLGLVPAALRNTVTGRLAGGAYSLERR